MLRDKGYDVDVKGYTDVNGDHSWWTRHNPPNGVQSQETQEHMLRVGAGGGHAQEL